MSEAVLEFVHRSIAPILFAAALMLALDGLGSQNEFLRTAKKATMSDVVFEQDSFYSENSEIVDASVVKSSVIMNPVCKITIKTGTTTVAYTCMSNGSYVVVTDSLNQAPGVNSKHQELVNSSAELSLSWIIGEYKQKEVYDDAGQLNEVIYERND